MEWWEIVVAVLHFVALVGLLGAAMMLFAWINDTRRETARYQRERERRERERHNLKLDGDS